VITSTSALVERNMTATRVLSCRPAVRCPDHKVPMDGGPTQYHCPEGHRVQAADLNREVTR
jgi:hypothetical protein